MLTRVNNLLEYGLRRLRKKESYMNKQLQAVAASYLRTAVSAVAAMYMAGHTEPKDLLTAALAAVLGPLARAINPKDTAFGKVAK